MPIAEVNPAALRLDPQSNPALKPLPSLARALLRVSVPAALVCMLLSLGLALSLGLREHRAEADAALETARLARYLGHLPQLSDAQALAVLRDQSGLRHLRLHVADAENRPLIDHAGPMPVAVPSVSWTVARPFGPPWTVTLSPHDSLPWERLAALAAVLLLAVGLSLALVLALIHWGLHRALQPLQGLLRAVGEVPVQGLSRLRQLPPLAVAELEQIGAALRQMAGALERSEAARRTRAQRVAALREGERASLGHALDGELGERLSALRLDLSWLRRQVSGNPGLLEATTATLERVVAAQQRLRGLLTSLQPLARWASARSAALRQAEAESPERLRERLQELTDLWSDAGGGRVQCALDFQWHLDPGSEQPTHLPTPLLLALYRLSEDALRLVAQSAAVQRAQLILHLHPGRGQVHWALEDDAPEAHARDEDDPLARELLAALHEQAWAHGGTLNRRGLPGRRGRRLSVELPLPGAGH
jgi:two-component system, NarL family, sensor histidine kinase UhpB